MSVFKVVYLARPRQSFQLDREEFFRNAQAYSRNGRSGWTWGDLDAKNSDVHYFAAVDSDGTLLISNSEQSLRSTTSLRNTGNVPRCAPDVEALSLNPYWIKRIGLPSHPIHIHGPFAEKEVRWISLAVQKSRAADLVVHGDFREDGQLQQSGIFNFVRSGGEYSAHLQSPNEAAPVRNFWAAVLGVFGFELFV